MIPLATIQSLGTGLRARIRLRMQHLDMSAREVSVDAGLSETAIRDIFRRPNGDPGSITVYKLATSLQCSPGWLAYDEREISPHLPSVSELTGIERQLNNSIARSRLEVARANAAEAMVAAQAIEISVLREIIRERELQGSDR